ncbi:NAD-binding protein [Porticoccaceae bacterium]|nr:NAD-binding protein [Porticoccaceae bacterium]
MKKMRNKFTLKERFSYFFDNTLSAGTVAIIGWLALASVLIVFVSALIITGLNLKPFEVEDMSFAEAFWQSFMRTLDPGTVAGDEDWTFRGLSILVTIGGILILSTLIGTLTTGLEAKLVELRKGRSKIIEQDHTLILGWSPKIFTIVSELIIANENQKSPRIVIMADEDKVWMEDQLRANISDRKNTKIICRTGSSLDMSDLDVVDPHRARSIIIISPNNTFPDISVIKTVLAITNSPSRRDAAYHIVAEIKDPSNLEAALLVGRDEASFVYSADLIAQVTAQACRQSGLSVVYTELLDFAGDEIYFKDEPELVGKTFKDAIFAFENSSIMGLIDSSGSVRINPAMDTVINSGSQVIAIAEDDDTIVLSGKTAFGVDISAMTNINPTQSVAERSLILGWNEKGAAIVKELDQYVVAGSELLIIDSRSRSHGLAKEIAEQITNQRVEVVQGDTTDRKFLDSIDISRFSNLILLGDTQLDIQQADAKTLITLLHIRNISEETGIALNVVSEMFDQKNRQLAEVTKADDFIVSDNLTSLMMAQLSENVQLKNVFDVLFGAEGSEIYLKPLSDYVVVGAEINFYTLLEAAALQGQTAIGYRRAKDAYAVDKMYGVNLNPVKSEKFIVQLKDKLIVLAES